MTNKSASKLKEGVNALFSMSDEKSPEVASEKAAIVSSESELASSEQEIVTQKSEVANKESQVASNVLEITNKESQVASNVLEITNNESAIATQKPVIANNGIDAEKLDAAMKSYFEDPRVTLYADVGGAILSYLHRTHAIDSISAEGAKAMEAELKRKNPDVWKAIQHKLKTEDKWKPILDKRGKRKRRA